MTDKNAQALEALIHWLTAALNCRDWRWDEDQRKLAEYDVAKAKRALESAAPSAAEPVATPAHSDKNVEFADWMLHGIDISGEAADGFKLNAAVRDVLVERQRQISIEGWSTEHDDRYKSGELASASAAYSAAAAEQLSGWDGEMIPPRWWPWDPLWWRPSDPRRNLVKAGALILAEIERLDRATGAAAPPAPSATSADAPIVAKVDALQGLKLLPPIRVPDEVAEWLETLASFKGQVVQAVVRDLLEEERARLDADTIYPTVMDEKVEREAFDLTQARAIVVDAIRRMRAGHVACHDLTMLAEDFLRATHAAAKSDALWDQTLQERDKYHEWADQLAARISTITGVDIGEHSSANCPWQNAVDAADEFTLPAVQPEAETSAEKKS